MSIKKNVLLGITASLGGFSVKTLLNLAIIPLVITTMGASQYGVYILLITIIEMVSDLARGVTGGLTLRLGQTLNPDVTPEHLAMLRLGLWAHLAAALLMFGLGALLTPLLVSSIHWPAALLNTVSGLILLALAEGCLYSLSGFFQACLSAHTRLGVSHSVDMGQAIATNLIIVGLLSLGIPFMGLMVARCLVAVVCVVVMGWLSRREWGYQTDWHYALIQMAEVKHFWDVSWVNILTMLLLLVSCRLDGMIIGSFLTLTSVAAYGIVQRIYGQAVFIGIRLASVLNPVITRFAATGQDDKIRPLFLRTSQGLCFFACFLMLWITWFFPSLFQLLSRGKLNVQLTLPVIWVMVPYVIIIISAIPTSSYLYSKNLYKKVLTWTAQSAGVNLLISIIMVKQIGIAGAALGTLVSTLYDRIIRGVPTTCHLLGIPLSEYINTVYVKNLLPVAVAAALLWLSMQAFGAMHPLAQFFVCGGLAFTGSGLLWAFQNLHTTERQQVTNKIKALFNKRQVCE